MSPPAHALPFGQELVDKGNPIQNPAADEEPQEGIQKAKLHDEDRCQKENRDARQADDVRDDLMVQIDESDDDQGADEGKGEDPLKCDAVLPEEQEGEGGGDRFHQRVAEGDLLSAVPAAATEQDVAEHGNVVVEPDGPAAPGAAGSGEDDGLLLRQPVNEDIEKTADRGAQNGEKNLHPESHAPSFLPFMRIARSRCGPFANRYPSLRFQS